MTSLKLFTFMILNENKSPLHTESIFINEITLQQNTIKSVESEFQNREILYQSREILKIRFCCFECFLMLSEKQSKIKKSAECGVPNPQAATYVPIAASTFTKGP